MFDYASKYHFVFEDFQINMLLMLIEEYVNGAELQISRIERTKKLIQKTLSSKQNLMSENRTTGRNRNRKLFCDAHFYFICLGQVNKCFLRLRAKLQNKNLDKVYTDFLKTFKQEIRNDLEHIDARAVGLKKKGRKEVSIGHISDFKNICNDYLTFNGKSYPMNKDSLKKLKGFYRKIISIIHEDYALKDSSFLYELKRDKYLKNIKKIAQIEYQNYLHSKKNLK